MVTRLGSRYCTWPFRLVRLLFASALLIASTAPSWALAQTSDDSWDVPLNLSHSGVAINPSFVIDSEAVVHAIWQDDLGDFVYTQREGDQWSAPKITDLNDLFLLPYASETAEQSQLESSTDPNPFFIAGRNQDIFAIWISRQGRLFTSQVQGINFEHHGAWDPRRLITPGVASFAATVDTNGDLHMAYLRTTDEPGYPSGIYYTRSKYNARSWTVPVPVYETAYFRKLGDDEANLSIATSGTEKAVHVYIAWDNRPRKQVLLAQSADGGKSWEQPVPMAGPAPDSGLAGPFNIDVGATQDNVVLIWQSGQPDGACTQSYRSSNNAGASWSEPQPLLKELSGCPDSNGFVTGFANNPGGPLYLLTETQSQVFLTAWNGRQWSEPKVQPILSGFEDPELYTEVIIGCHRTSLLGERLYIVGCDQGGGGDIWFTSRALGPGTSWFKPPLWSPPSPVTDENIEMEAIDLVATDDDLIHAFISQRRQPVINYTYWDGKSWSPITPALELPDGEVGLPAIAAGPGNELFLIAANDRGMLYFSWATSGSTATGSNWSTPTPLGLVHDGEIGSADVAWDAAGTVYVAYSVPVNEERGIYLVQSRDHGTSWSEPFQVFNGAAAGFDIVGAPSLLRSENGFLHLIWKQQSIQGDGVQQPVALYYTRSEDGGHSFNDAELVVQEPVAWREIVADGNGNLHLFWQPQETLTTVWDQVSLDDGNTWQYPQGLPNEGGLAAVTSDPAGRLHLVGVGPGALSHWLWDGSRWQSEAPVGWNLASQKESPVELLTAAVNKQGKLMIVLAEPAGDGDIPERTLRYSIRTLGLPQNQTTTQDVPTEVLSSPTIPAPTATPEPLLSPTALVDDQSVNQDQTDGAETNDPISPFAIALLPVAILLFSVLGIVIRQIARGKAR